jgi:hypothetical protein
MMWDVGSAMCDKKMLLPTSQCFIAYPISHISYLISPLALSLLMLGPFADNPDNPSALDNLAFAAYLFY